MDNSIYINTDFEIDCYELKKEYRGDKQIPISIKQESVTESDGKKNYMYSISVNTNEQSKKEYECTYTDGFSCTTGAVSERQALKNANWQYFIENGHFVEIYEEDWSVEEIRFQGSGGDEKR